MQKFDVVVVGAGPSGAAAAHTLAGRGMKVALLEKQRFPRDKLCGGLLSARAGAIYSQIFDQPWDDLIEASARGVEFFHQHRFLNGVYDHQAIHFTSRRAFDARLAAMAASRGATLIEGAAVDALSQSPTAVRLRSGATIRGDFLIGADGVNSRIGAALFPGRFDTRNLALGLEIELPLDRLLRPPQVPQIHFGVVRWGYGWVFPKRHSATVGIGGLRDKNPDLKTRFGEFLGHVATQPMDLRYQGHHIPFGNYRSRPGRDNILLAGDAAGWVEPITGEGIGFAMLSGQKAAEAIFAAAAMGNPGAALGLYTQACRPLLRTFSHAKLMRQLVFPSLMQGLLVSALRRSQSPIRQYLDLLAGTSDYSDYAEYLLRRLVAKKLALGKPRVP